MILAQSACFHGGVDKHNIQKINPGIVDAVQITQTHGLDNPPKLNNNPVIPFYEETYCLDSQRLLKITLRTKEGTAQRKLLMYFRINRSTEA